MQYGFVFNAKRCTGCKSCVAACRDYHDLGPDAAFRQVYECVRGGWAKSQEGFWQQDMAAYYVSIACNHCDEPACTAVCPTGAMAKREGGLVTVDVRRCVGCGYCAMACPYRAPRVDRTRGHSAKCDGCAARVLAGGAPVCVEACPLRALEFGDVRELLETYPGTTADITPLPPSTITKPNVAVVPPKVAGGDFRVVNQTELV